MFGMPLDNFPLDEYCARTGASTSGSANLEHLEELQRAQLYSIPFENFDIQLGRGIDLAPEHLIEKLLRRDRGGYCFELNGLFLSALRAAGYDARALLARVHVTGVPTGRGHQVNLVTIANRQWIVDAGFGGACPRAPIQLQFNTETRHDGWIFRICQHELGYMLQRKLADNWSDLYSFDLAPVVQGDIAYGNHFTSTHPSSFFTSSRVAALCHPEGQINLLNFNCTSTGLDAETVEDFPDDESYLLKLRDKFGIQLDAEYTDLALLDSSN